MIRVTIIFFLLLACLAEAVRIPFGLIGSQLAIRGSKINPSMRPRESMNGATGGPNPLETFRVAKNASKGLTDSEVRMILLRQAGF